MAIGFEARVQSCLRLKSRRVLVLEPALQGEIASGEWVEVQVGPERVPVRVTDVAWSSAFAADSAPLTIVVEGLVENEPEVGARVVGIPKPL
ncbi:MAG: hypothetical protein OEY14_13245 [Myxococcales bacterium]|nr:hypothetical protein [Myxococcales bacterium]